jgi:hypothetical protein
MRGPDLSAPFRPKPHERAEMQRLVDEGLLRRLAGPVLIAADVPDTAPLRARSVLLALAPAGAGTPVGAAATGVVGYAGAAWVHVGGPAPAQVDLIIPPGTTRPRRVPIRLHEHRLDQRDVQVLAGLRLTNPVRTAADIARGMPPVQVGPALLRLAGCGVRVIDVLDQLNRMPHGRGVAHARDVVLSWASALASVDASISR